MLSLMYNISLKEILKDNIEITSRIAEVQLIGTYSYGFFRFNWCMSGIL